MVDFLPVLVKHLTKEVVVSIRLPNLQRNVFTSYGKFLPVFGRIFITFGKTFDKGNCIWLYQISNEINFGPSFGHIFKPQSIF